MRLEDYSAFACAALAVAFAITSMVCAGIVAVSVAGSWGGFWNGVQVIVFCVSGLGAIGSLIAAGVFTVCAIIKGVESFAEWTRWG